MARVNRLRFGLQDLGQLLGVVGLEELRPALADEFCVLMEMLQEFEEELVAVAAIGVVRRAAHPLVEAFVLGDLAGIETSGHAIMNALARRAESTWRTNFRVGGEGRSLAHVDRQHAEVAGDFLDGKSSSRRVGIEDGDAAVAVDQFAGQTRRFLGLSLAVAHDKLDGASTQAASGVELLELEQRARTRRGAEHGDPARADRDHADLDWVILGQRNVRKACNAGRCKRPSGFQYGAPARYGLFHVHRASPCPCFPRAGSSPQSFVRTFAAMVACHPACVKLHFVGVSIKAAIPSWPDCRATSSPSG